MRPARTRRSLGSSVVTAVLATLLLVGVFAAAGCGDSHHHHDPEPAALLVVNQSPYFALFSLDDCASYETDWLAPGESVWIDVWWSVDNGDLPGTILPCFYFESYDGTIAGHVGYGPVWVVPGDAQSIVFG